MGGATTASSKTKSNHPTVEAGDRLSALLSQFIVVNPQYKAFKAQHETLSRDIGAETRPMYFDHFAGLVPESSTMLTEVDHRGVKLIVKDAYSKNVVNDEALRRAIGDDLVEKYFEWRTEYKVDYSKIPEAKQEPFANGVEELRARLGVPAEAVTAKQYLAPRAGFHQSRTVLLTAEQNKALDNEMPVTAYPMLA
jgi:hypothetical protein